MAPLPARWSTINIPGPDPGGQGPGWGKPQRSGCSHLHFPALPQLPLLPRARPHPYPAIPGPRAPFPSCPGLLQPWVSHVHPALVPCVPASPHLPAPLDQSPYPRARLVVCRGGWQSWGVPAEPVPPPAHRQRPDLPVHQCGRGLHPLPGRGVAAPGLPGDPRLHPGTAAPPAREPAAGWLGGGVLGCPNGAGGVPQGPSGNRVPPGCRSGCCSRYCPSTWPWR